MTKSIVVLAKHPSHKREIRFFVFDSANLHSADLSELKLNDVTDIINKLTTLVSNSSSNAYYEWGVDLYTVFSTPVTSSCTNEIEGTTLPDVSTSSLLNLMTEIGSFKLQYKNISNLYNIIGQAFTQIKANPSQYRISSNGSYYNIQISGITISLNVNNDDLNLGINDFLNQLDTNF